MKDDTTFEGAARAGGAHGWEGHPRGEFREATYMDDSLGDGRSKLARRSGSEHEREVLMPVHWAGSALTGFYLNNVARRRIVVLAALVSSTGPVNDLPLSQASP